MTYEEWLAELRANGEPREEYTQFQSRILNTKLKLLGVTTPVMRKIAKKHKGEYYIVKTFPAEYYETVFLSFALAAYLPYEEIKGELDFLLSEADTWSLTDTFNPKCFKENEEDFFHCVVEKYSFDEREFYSRFALVMLLQNYMKEKYLPYIFVAVTKVNCQKYYVYMAAAWLVAEVLVKFFDEGVRFLKEHKLDKRTHNKAIQKARESFRLSDEQKEKLKDLKIY